MPICEEQFKFTYWTVWDIIYVMFIGWTVAYFQYSIIRSGVSWLFLYLMLENNSYSHSS